MGRKSRIRDSDEAAWQWLTEEYAKSLLGISTGDATTVGDLLQIWVEQHLLKETTRAEWRRVIRNILQPHPISLAKANEVKPANVEALMRDLPPNYTLKTVASVLSSFFDWCERNDLSGGIREIPTGSQEPRRSSDGRLST